MTGRLVVLAATAAALLGTASTALAGGWATADLSSTPAGVEPGKPWVVQMTVLQHGRTPLDGVEPAVVIRKGEMIQRFAARPTGRPGIYEARVVFPTGGSWSYATDDGFGGTHDFPAVRIGDAAATTAATAPAAGGDDFPWWIAAGGAALVLVLGGTWLARRTRPVGPVPG